MSLSWLDFSYTRDESANSAAQGSWGASVVLRLSQRQMVWQRAGTEYWVRALEKQARAQHSPQVRSQLVGSSHCTLEFYVSHRLAIYSTKLMLKHYGNVF